MTTEKNHNAALAADERDVIDSALWLAETSGSHAFMLPVPNTTPALYVALGEAEQLAKMVKTLPSMNGGEKPTDRSRADALTDARCRSLLSHADEMDAYGWKDDAEAIRLLLAASPVEQPAAAPPMKLLGETRENGVVWFDQNPHAFPIGTKFYAASDEQPAAEPKSCSGQEQCAWPACRRECVIHQPAPAPADAVSAVPDLSRCRKLRSYGP